MLPDMTGMAREMLGEKHWATCNDVQVVMERLYRLSALSGERSNSERNWSARQRKHVLVGEYKGREKGGVVRRLECRSPRSAMDGQTQRIYGRCM